MSQEKILSLLKRDNERWFTAKDITRMSDQSGQAIRKSLSILRRTGFINFIYDPQARQYKYQIK